MKFSFEKTSLKEESELDIEELTSQDFFDEQCIEEANKLNINIESIKEDINIFGGPEKFKEYFEEIEQGKRRGTRAIEAISTIEKSSNQKFDMYALLFAFSSLGNSLAIEILGKDFVNKLEIVKNAFSSDNHTNEEEVITTSVILLVTLLATTSFGIKAIMHQIENRKIIRQKKIEELKLRMTGTKV